MRKTKKRSQLTNKRKRFLIANAFLALLLFLGVGYSALSTNLNFFGSITVNEYLEPTLYNVLKKASQEGYAKEYIGDHQDSMAGVGTEKIYHWYADTDAAGNQKASEIQNKNNVIFAGHCWQMIRTTDTGGVKMIYNGEAENGQCLSTRSNHIGYSERLRRSLMSTSFSTSYYYGTSYTYDKTNNVFSLDGTITTGTIQIGQYTCKSTSSTGTCETLYLVSKLLYGTTYSVLPLKKEAHYSQFGILEFNDDYNSPAYAGYMYNTIYENKAISRYNLGDLEYITNPISQSDYNIISNDTTYPFTFDTTTNRWTSTMKQDSTSASIIFNVASDGDYTLSYSISSEKDFDKAYFYKNGTELKNDSGIQNGSIILEELTTSDEIEVKYSKDSSGSNGTDSVSFSIGIPAGTIDNRYQFGNNVEYINGEYKLTDTVKAAPEEVINGTLDYHHYTCFTQGDTCAKVSYIYNMYENVSYEGLYYIELENGKTIQDAVNEMLYNNNVNTIDSTMKTGIEAWYKRYMTEYTNYLEDIIFCNDRSQSNSLNNGWNPNSGNTDIMRFVLVNNTSLSCANTTDKFSTSNNKAQLTYPIGLMTYPELELLDNTNIITNPDKNYWLISPYEFDYMWGATSSFVSNYGSGFSQTGYNKGVRPVISLKPGTEYVLGNGSKENPYYVGEM